MRITPFPWALFEFVPPHTRSVWLDSWERHLDEDERQQFVARPVTEALARELHALLIARNQANLSGTSAEMRAENSVFIASLQKKAAQLCKEFPSLTESQAMTLAGRTYAEKQIANGALRGRLLRRVSEQGKEEWFLIGVASRDAREGTTAPDEITSDPKVMSRRVVFEVDESEVAHFCKWA